MSDNESGNKWVAVVVPIVVAVLGLIGVMVQTDWFSARMTPPTPTLPPTTTGTVASVPTRDPTETSISPTKTDIPPEFTETPIPLPLEEIFPQAGDGEAFSFVNNPAVFTGEIVRDECVHSGVYGLKLIYDIKNAGNAGWGVQWTNALAGTVDLSGYVALTFWVKGGTGEERFQVGLKDALKREEKIESTDLIVLSENWQRVRVPLNRFRNVNLGLINNFNFGLNKNHANGVICIDDIALE